MDSRAWPDVPVVIRNYVDEARRAAIVRALLSSPDQDVFVQEASSPRFYGVAGEAKATCVRLHAFLRHFESSAARGAVDGGAAAAGPAAGASSAGGAPYSYLSQACYEAADAGSVQLRVDPAAAATPKPHDTLPRLFRGGAFQVACLWMAPTALESNTHYDADDNLLVVLAGSKRVRLAAPCCRAIDRPRDLAASGHHTRTRLFDSTRGDGAAATSSIVELPRVPLEEATAAAAAAAPCGGDGSGSAASSAAAAAATAATTSAADSTIYEAVVAAGDALVIPEGWWHNVQSTGGCIAVNFWYGGRAAGLRAAPPPAKPYLLQQLLMSMAAEEAARTVAARRRSALVALRQAHDGAACSAAANGGALRAHDLHSVLRSLVCPLVGCGAMADALHAAAAAAADAVVGAPLVPMAAAATLLATAHASLPQASAAAAPTSGGGTSCSCTASAFLDAVSLAIAHLADDDDGDDARWPLVGGDGGLRTMDAVSQAVCHLLACLRGQALHAVFLMLLRDWAGAAVAAATAGATIAPGAAAGLASGEASLYALFNALQRPSLQPDGSVVEQCMADAFEEEGPLAAGAAASAATADSAGALPPWAAWLSTARLPGVNYGSDVFFELAAGAGAGGGGNASSGSGTDDDTPMTLRPAPTTLELIGGALSDAQAAGLRRAIAAVMHDHMPITSS